MGCRKEIRLERQQQEMEAEAGAGRASSPEGALPLQVGLIPLLDLGVDRKMFPDEGMPLPPRWMWKCGFIPPDLR